MGKRGVRAGTRTVHGNHLTQTVSTAMMPLRNECLRWVRQPSCRVTLNRLVADDFCCYVMPLGITLRQESFLFWRRSVGKQRIEQNQTSAQHL